MSAPEPPVVTNWADADKAALAVHALLAELKQDPRVYDAYVVWSQARGLETLVASLAALQTAEPTEEYLALVHVFGAVLTDPQDLSAVEALDLCERLGLSYAWLPQLLVVQFRIWAYAAARGEREDDLRLATRRRPGTALAAGRAQKGGAATIARNVEWYYRAEIQEPPDSISALAREYARTARRHTDARSVVQAGIRRAEQLLSIPCIVPPAI